MKYFSLLLLFIAVNIRAQTISNFTKNSYGNSISVYNTTDTTGILTQVGRWAWGQMGNTAVVGNYAFIGNGAMFQVLDVSQPSSPKIVSEVLTNGLVGSIKIHGNYAYITGPFQIIDISDPLHPKIVAEPQVGDLILGLTIDGNYLYAGTFSGFVYIFDLTDPVNPKLLSTLNAGGDNTNGIVIMGNYLYTTAKSTYSIYEFDISNKTNPVLVAQWNDGSYLGWVYGYGKYLYFLSYNNYMRIYDASSPGALVQTASLTTPAGIKSLFVSDTLAYLGIYQDSTRFRVVDVADAHHPKIISSIYWTDPILDFHNVGYSSVQALSGNTGYISTNIGLWIIDKTNIYNVKTLSFFITSGSANWIAIDSLNRAYVATLFTGLKIIDYSDPSSPHLIGQYLPHDRVDYVCVSGNYAYVLGDTDLQVVNISNPSAPVEEDTIPLAYSSGNSTIVIEGRMLVTSSKLFVVGSAGKLFAIDVSNPLAATVKSIITTKTTPIYLSVSGNYLYVTDIDSAIEIFDISDLTNIFEKTTINVSGGIRAAEIKGLNLYAIIGGGFDIYDVSDSLNPIELSRISALPMGISYALIVPRDSIVYLGYNGSVVVVDVSNKMYPFVKDTLETSYPVESIVNDKNILIVAGGDYGVFFYKNNLITGVGNQRKEMENYILYQNYPNPFNPTTIIRYQIPNAGKVLLKIYDVLGREVETLVNYYQTAGLHSVEFNAQNLPSGVYLYRLTSHGRSTTRKLVLLK